MAERIAEHGFATVYWSEGKSRRDQTFISKVDTLGNFILRCTRHRMTDETPEQYAAMTKEQRGDAKDVGGFVGGVFKDNKRGGDYLQKRTMLTLDLDKGKYDPAEVLERTHESLGGAAVIGYTSHSHTPQEPRIRLVIPLAKPITEMSTFARLVATVIERCALKDYTDECSARPAQLFYWPSAPKGAAVWAGHRMGPLFDPAKHLPKSIAPTETRSAMTDQHPGTAKVLTPDSYAAPRLGDPREKAGLIGAFCRAWYPITRAIDELLNGVYVKSGRGRYRYYQSDSEGGLIIKDGGLHAFSNHTNTDPAADGHSHNAYDLVRIHRFGGDEGRMRDFAQADAATIKELFPAALTEGDTEVPQRAAAAMVTRHDGADGDEDDGENCDFDGRLAMDKRRDKAPLRKSEEWVLMLDLKKDGTPKNTPTNARIILQNDPRLKDAIHFNLHSDDLVATPRLPWYHKTHANDTGEYAAWCDPDSKHLTMYLSDCYGFIGEKSIDAACEVVARDYNFHPIRDYLSGLEWDGTPRVEKMIIDYLGAEDNACTRQMTELMMVGAVARVFRPGVKFDYMTILQGEQGTLKSTLCRTLFDPWFLDEFNFNGNKDEIERIRGIWGIEVGELAGMRKAEIQNVKGTVSRQEDIYRASYGRRAQKHPRQCIFLGTTNDTHFLKDDKNRRFNLIPIDKRYRKFGEQGPEQLAKDKDQLWAEAMHLYRTKWEGKPLILSRENAEEQERRNQGVNMNRLDPVRADLEAYLNKPVPTDWASEGINDRRHYIMYGEPKEGYVLRHEFSLKAFLWEVYGCSSEVEAKRKDASLAGQLGNRVAGYLQEFGKWVGPFRKRTSCYGRTLVYERVDNPYIDAPEDDEL